MPIELGIWKLGEELQPVEFLPIDSESKHEEVLCENLSLMSPDLMLIGRQIATDFGKFMDFLAMDSEGNLSVIELKRDRTPREVVAQILDFGSWVQNLSHEQITTIYAEKSDDNRFEEGFAECFDTRSTEELNQRIL